MLILSFPAETTNIRPKSSSSFINFSAALEYVGLPKLPLIATTFTPLKNFCFSI